MISSSVRLIEGIRRENSATITKDRKESQQRNSRDSHGETNQLCGGKQVLSAIYLYRELAMVETCVNNIEKDMYAKWYVIEIQRSCERGN